MNRAVVFAYHNVGVRCLSVLLAQGVKVPLVVTHRDDPHEHIWFASVAELAALHGIPFITPEDPNDSSVFERVAQAQPDFLFSFYYRHMLKPYLLALAARGAYNMHGSLLPKYRGRVPVNWAVIKGERETGATLHEMVEKPDAGRIVDSQAVPILPDDTALEVFNKVTVAAEIVLDRALPALVGGIAPHRSPDLSHGSYFGGRRPEDGRIDWRDCAQAIHNLIRGVAPPYPGAFSDLPGGRLRALRSLHPTGERGPFAAPHLFARDGRLYAQCGDGMLLRIIDAQWNGETLGAGSAIARAGLPLIPHPSPLTT
jgi:methionyl-tRNA formyltransferase